VLVSKVVLSLGKSVAVWLLMPMGEPTEYKLFEHDFKKRRMVLEAVKEHVPHLHTGNILHVRRWGVPGPTIWGYAHEIYKKKVEVRW
jgi:hypothetical protein